MSNFLFWQKWLFVVGLALTVFGLALAFFNQTPAFDFLFNNQINPAFWSTQEITLQITKFQQWSYGVLGATVAGWGVFFAFVARYPFRNQERWAWNAVAQGITVWFVTDTALSLYFGVGFNVIFNSVLFVMVLLPLVFTRSAFDQGRA